MLVFDFIYRVIDFTKAYGIYAVTSRWSSNFTSAQQYKNKDPASTMQKSSESPAWGAPKSWTSWCACPLKGAQGSGMHGKAFTFFFFYWGAINVFYIYPGQSLGKACFVLKSSDFSSHLGLNRIFFSIPFWSGGTEFPPLLPPKRYLFCLSLGKEIWATTGSA